MKIGGYKDNVTSTDIDLSSEVQDTSVQSQGSQATEIEETETAHVITYNQSELIDGSYIVIFKEGAFPSL